jgi:hypothetical protein
MTTTRRTKNVRIRALDTIVTVLGGRIVRTEVTA